MSLERKKIDDLAAQAGGYFSLPTEDSKAYTDLLFDICRQLASATIQRQRRSAIS